MREPSADNTPAARIGLASDLNLTRSPTGPPTGANRQIDDDGGNDDDDDDVITATIHGLQQLCATRGSQLNHTEEQLGNVIASTEHRLPGVLDTVSKSTLLKLCKTFIIQHCGMLNKVDEAIVALEGHHAGWTLNSDSYGPDLTNATTAAICEVKSSNVKMGPKETYTANWNFSLNATPPNGASLECLVLMWAYKLIGKGNKSTEVMQALTTMHPDYRVTTNDSAATSSSSGEGDSRVASDYCHDGIAVLVQPDWELMKNSTVRLDAMYGVETLNTYIAPALHMAVILALITFRNGGSTKINLGGVRCRPCGRYHRVAGYIDYVAGKIGPITQSLAYNAFLTRFPHTNGQIEAVKECAEELYKSPISPCAH